MAVQPRDLEEDDDYQEVTVLPPRQGRPFRDVTTDPAQHWEPRTFRPYQGEALQDRAPAAPALRHVTHPPQTARSPHYGLALVVAVALTALIGAGALRAGQGGDHVASDLAALAHGGTPPAQDPPPGTAEPAPAPPTTVSIYDAQVNIYTDKPVQVNGTGSGNPPPQSGGGGDLPVAPPTVLPTLVAPTATPTVRSVAEVPPTVRPTEVTHYVDRVQTVVPARATVPPSVAVGATVAPAAPLFAPPTEVTHYVDRVQKAHPPKPTVTPASADNPANW